VEKRSAFVQEILRRVKAIPGVEESALGTPSSLPLGTTRAQFPFTIANRAAEKDRAPVAEFSSASPDLFRVLRTPLVRGRVFTEADDVKGQPVVLINEALAGQFWQDGDPVGQTIIYKLSKNRLAKRQDVSATIVGVVADIRSDGFDVASPPRVYTPVFQNATYATVIYVRTGLDSATLAESVRRAVQAVDPSVPVFHVRSMDEAVAKSLAERRFVLQLLGVFASIALLLAAIGIYGVMAYTFSQRTREIGIRMTFGAQRGDILRLALGEGALLVVFGIATGLAGALVLTRFLQSMLFNVETTDPITFSAIALLLGGVALLACFVPALRATRVAPLVALRYE
jgi:putative ABC transport system permease protein